MLISKLFEVGGYSSPKEQLFGIECEIESLKNVRKIPDTFQVHDDGSLRNNGKEFVTVPMGLKENVEAFKNLHASLVFVDKAVAFSSRTSIHVHMNCQNLDEKVVRKAVLFYALFEETFFALVDPSRRNNIHCVALTDTPLVDIYRASLSSMRQSWSKYTALNLLPLGSLGTIEFRHMHGHDDPRLLEEWLTCLERLMVLARTTELSAQTMTRANIGAWFSFLFGHTQNFSALWKRLDESIENTLIDVKIGLM